ncbi:MAG: Pb-reticulocyte-binding protein, partial [Richelia sp. SL_2_1]|nr:Pb-reticulocyte-binding protein [Richelia sp. SL_2_1]
MIQAINSEQVFVTNLEDFMTKADKFIKTYYSGVSDENHVK